MNLFIPWVAAAVITFIATPAVKKFACRFHLVDDPKKRYHPAHTHTGVIPRAGGLALFVGFFLSLLMFLPFTKLLIGITLSSTILVIVGLLDDIKDVHPYIRLISNACAALLVIAFGVGIPYITNPFTGGVIMLDAWKVHVTFFGSRSIVIWADILSFIWIMWTMNIVGWSAGVDGQMPGFVGISAFVLGLLSLRYSIVDPSQIWVSVLAFIVSGVYIGFLPWNFYPQKIMPGYSGKTLAGFLLALLGILSFGKLGTALLVLGIPSIDAIYTLIRRLQSKQPLVRADRGHLHHLLLGIGWGKRRIALFYWGVSAILGIIALRVTSKQKMFVFLLVTVLVLGIILWLNFFTQFSNQQDQDNG